MKSLMGICLALGCVGASAQQVIADCYASNGRVASFSLIDQKVGGASGKESYSLDQLSNEEKPTADERAAIKEWYEGRQRCTEMGANFLAVNDPGAVPVFRATQAKLMLLISGLYAGDFTYGKMLKERVQIGIEGRRQAAEYAAARRQAQQQRQANADREYQDTMNTIIQMEALQRQNMQRSLIPPTVNCTSRQVGGTVQTQCN